MVRVGTGAPELILASSSPRRLDLMRAIGLEPEVAAADIDERPQPGEKPVELVERLALAKARAVADGLAAIPSGGGATGTGRRLVVGADTVIDLDGSVLGKPTDRADARRMLDSLRGRDHGVTSGVAVVAVAPGGGPERPGSGEAAVVAAERTEVVMRAFDDVELDWYLDSGEHRGKAGAYAIQGLGSLLIRGIEGSYANVVGLPVTLLDRLTTELGHPLRQLVPEVRP